VKPGNESIVDTNFHKYRGKGTVDLTPLLQPGADSLPSLRFSVSNYATTDIPPLPAFMTEKKGRPRKSREKDRPDTLLEDKSNVEVSKSRSSRSVRKSKTKKEEFALEEGEVDNPYEVAHTYLIIQLSLSKPLYVRVPTPRVSTL
jgi:hypothetical protein